MTPSHQISLSMEYPRQECWSGLPLLSPGYLPYPGIKPASPALAGGFFTTEPSVQFSSVTQLCPTLCNRMNHKTPGLPVHQQFLQFTQTQWPLELLRGLRPLVELCVEPAGLCGRCTGVAVPLRVVPSPTGLCIPGSPGESGLCSRGSNGLRSPLE